MGTFFSVQHAVKQMVKQSTGGSVVMVASVAATCAIPSQRLSGYGMSKGGVRILGQHLAVELAPLNIRCNTLSPGVISTDMTATLAESHPELLDVFTNEPPLRRMGDRTDLMAAVVYLLSDVSAYTTGTDLLVTGGLHAGRI
jgi:sorbose reductase